MSSRVQRRGLMAALAGSACLGISPLGYSPLALAGWFDKAKPIAYLPLPVFDASTPLRVVYAHNPRFKRPEPQLLTDVLARTQTLCKLHLRLNVTFDTLVEHEISSLFQGITPALWKRVKADIYDYRDGAPDRKRLIADMKNSLALNSSPIAAKIAFAKPHLISAVNPTNANTLAETLIDTQLARFAAWQKLKGIDGQDLLNDHFYNEFYAWVHAPRTQAWPFEVVMTNQLITSTEYVENTIHSALRGGVSNGITTQSPSSRYGTVSVCSLFPMTSMDSLTRQLRNDPLGQEPQSVEAVAALLTHELGHQLLHLGHPFNSKACVMNPAELLRFDAWTKGLDAAQCPIGNVPENKPGALRITVVK
jgi:hypothetical protein